MVLKLWWKCCDGGEGEGKSVDTHDTGSGDYITCYGTVENDDDGFDGIGSGDSGVEGGGGGVEYGIGDGDNGVEGGGGAKTFVGCVLNSLMTMVIKNGPEYGDPDGDL